MISREQIIAAARSLIGTRYQHQGRLPGIGLDCMGVVIAVAHAVGHAQNFDYTAYGVLPDPAVCNKLLLQYMEPVPVSDALPGDVLFMRFVSEPQHLGIVSDLCEAQGLIHSYMTSGGVVEHRLDEVWRSRVVSAWRFPGVA